MTEINVFNANGRGFRKFTVNPNPAYDWAHEVVTDIKDADVIISEVDWDTHRPVLDIDIPHKYYPSSTEGHGHLYLDIDLTHEQYTDLLYALVQAGIIEGGYYSAFQSRGYTAVRLPWIKKNS